MFNISCQCRVLEVFSFSFVELFTEQYNNVKTPTDKMYDWPTVHK